MNNLDLIKQYVDTGLQIPDYQINKLNKNLFNTYLRKRLISIEQGGVETLTNFEYELLNEPQKNKYFEILLNQGRDLSDEQYAEASDNIKLKYLKRDNLYMFKLSDKKYVSTPNNLKLDFIKARIKVKSYLNDEQYALAPDDIKLEYIKKYKPYLTKQQYIDTPDNIKAEYIRFFVSIRAALTNQQYADAPYNLKAEYIRMIINGELEEDLTPEQYANTPDNLKSEYNKFKLHKS